MEKYEEIERSVTKSFKGKIWGKFIKAVTNYELISPGDHIAVCVSGGKDSALLAVLMKIYCTHVVKDVKVSFIGMDPGYEPVNKKLILENAKNLGIPLEMFETDIFEAVDNVDTSCCFICARMRRGYLYRKAKELGCNKIALGHHYDDVIETILMSMLYGAQVETMLPKLKSDNVEGMELIRPLYLIREADIEAWRDNNELKFLKCACKATKASESNVTQRAKVKTLIAELKKENPMVESNIFGSVTNVNLDRIMGYTDGAKKVTFLDRMAGK